MPQESLSTNQGHEIPVKNAELLECGREAVMTKEQLETYPIGSSISYLNSSCEFQQGGFIIKYADEWFAFITPEFDLKVRVRYTNVLKMWVGNVFKTTDDIVSITRTKQKKTNFPVMIGNIPVFYGRKSYYAIRFRFTERYRRMADWHNYFYLNYLCAQLTIVVHKLRQSVGQSIVSNFKMLLCSDICNPEVVTCIDIFISSIPLEGEEIRSNRHVPGCFCSSIGLKYKDIIKEYCNWADERRLPNASNYDGLNRLDKLFRA